jgi:hypothetical protein
MPPTQQHAHQGLPTDLDLALEARANAWGLPTEDRDAILRTAELLGCDIAVARIRETARRRSQVRPAPAPSPRPGPKPRPTAARPPILVALDGQSAPATHDEQRREHLLRTARLAEQGARSDWATPSERIALASAALRCRRAATD